MAVKSLYEYFSCGCRPEQVHYHLHQTEDGADSCARKRIQADEKHKVWLVRKAKIDANREKKRLAAIEVERKLVENVPKEFIGMKEDGLALVINRGILKADLLPSAITNGVFQDYHVGYNSVMEWFNGR
jgi:hypothetical protein